jgi:hypothetical protein
MRAPKFVEAYRTREEAVPHCSAGRRCAMLGELTALVRLMWQELRIRSRRSGGALRQLAAATLRWGSQDRGKWKKRCHGMVWRGEREPASKTATRTAVRASWQDEVELQHQFVKFARQLRLL